MTKENPEMVLVTSSGDWGDEFDLEGFGIFIKEEWELIKEGIPDKPFEAYFGSNEFVTFEDKKDYLSHVKEKPITLEQAKGLCNLLDAYFNGKSATYGLFVINSENY